MIIIVVRDANAIQMGKGKGRMMVKLLTLHVAIEKTIILLWFIYYGIHLLWFLKGRALKEACNNILVQHVYKYVTFESDGGFCTGYGMLSAITTKKYYIHNFSCVHIN